MGFFADFKGFIEQSRQLLQASVLLNTVNKEDGKMNEFITQGYISKIDLNDETFMIEPIQNYKFELDKGYEIIFRRENVNMSEAKLYKSETWFKYGNNFVSILLSLKQAKNLVELHISEDSTNKGSDEKYGINKVQVVQIIIL